MKIEKLEDLKVGMIVELSSLQGTFTICHDPQRNRLFAWGTMGQEQESSLSYATWCRAAELNYIDTKTFRLMGTITMIDQKAEPAIPTRQEPTTREQRIFVAALEKLQWQAQRQLWIAALDTGGPHGLLQRLNALGALLATFPGGLTLASMLPAFNNGLGASTLTDKALNAREWTISAGTQLCEAGFALGEADTAEPQEAEEAKAEPDFVDDAEAETAAE